LQYVDNVINEDKIQHNKISDTYQADS